jgi:hypothetical protein
MSFALLGGNAAGVWRYESRNDVDRFRSLKNKTLITRCAVEVPLAAIADAPLVLYDLGRNHGLFPSKWIIREEPIGPLALLLDIPRTPEVIRESLPQARIITSCTEVVR